MKDCFLLVDTTYFFVLGLFHPEKGLIDYVCDEEKNAVRQFHAKVSSFLIKNQCDIHDLKGVVYCNGPGNYNNLRIGYSFAQSFKLFDKLIHSFTHLDVALICDDGFLKNGIWLANANKDEHFICYGEKGQLKNKIVPNHQLVFQAKKYDKSYTAFSSFISNELSSQLHLIETGKILKNNAKNILNKILSKNSNELPFYFRAPEDEYKVANLC